MSISLSLSGSLALSFFRDILTYQLFVIVVVLFMWPPFPTFSNEIRIYARETLEKLRGFSNWIHWLANQIDSRMIKLATTTTTTTFSIQLQSIWMNKLLDTSLFYYNQYYCLLVLLRFLLSLEQLSYYYSSSFCCDFLSYFVALSKTTINTYCLSRAILLEPVLKVFTNNMSQ